MPGRGRVELSHRIPLLRGVKRGGYPGGSIGEGVVGRRKKARGFRGFPRFPGLGRERERGKLGKKAATGSKEVSKGLKEKVGDMQERPVTKRWRDAFLPFAMGLWSPGRKTAKEGKQRVGGPEENYFSAGVPPELCVYRSGFRKSQKTEGRGGKNFLSENKHSG